jgi:GNAT superfamily N-acetyltransferase
MLREVISNGHLFLVFQKDELVGMSNFKKIIDGHGWLSMARTDPDWRGKGVAQFLQQSIGSYAKKRGSSKLRMFVLETNEASLRAAAKGGFKEVCDVSFMYRKVRKLKNPSTPIPARPSIKSLLESPYVKDLGGYMGYWWEIVKASREVFRRILAKGEIYSKNTATVAITGHDTSEREVYRDLTVLEGPLGTALQLGLDTAQALGTDSLGTFLPYKSSVLKIATNAGFKKSSWGWHLIVLEKSV